MTLNELIERADAAYPDGVVSQYWDPRQHAVRADADAGDTLALFIVRELKDTFDPQASDADQIATAATAIQRAIKELEAVREALFIDKDKTTQDLIRQALALHDSIFVTESYGSHDIHEYDALLAELEKQGYVPVNTVAFVRKEVGDEDA